MNSPEEGSKKNNLKRNGLWLGLIVCVCVAVILSLIDWKSGNGDPVQGNKKAVKAGKKRPNNQKKQNPNQRKKGKAGKKVNKVGHLRQKRVLDKEVPEYKPIMLGLLWLSTHQSPGGYWDCDGFPATCKVKDKPCVGKGHPLNDVGATGLALLAFLGMGHTHNRGQFKDNVANGMAYLVKVQDEKTGCFVPQEGEHYMYNHGVACLAFLENYGLTGEKLLRGPAQRAVDFIRKARNPGKGWRYNLGNARPEDQNDVCVTGWMLKCLAAARNMGFVVTDREFSEALSYIDEMTNPVTGRTGYRVRGAGSSREKGDELVWPFDKVEAMTGLGVYCRVLCGKALGKLEDQKAICSKGASLIMKKVPRWDEKKGTIDYHYWLYGSEAIFQMGDPMWEKWSKYLTWILKKKQVKGGCERGSWDPQKDPWGDNGGRVYATALCVISLETAIRNNRLFQKK